MKLIVTATRNTTLVINSCGHCLAGANQKFCNRPNNVKRKMSGPIGIYDERRPSPPEVGCFKWRSTGCSEDVAFPSDACPIMSGFEEEEEKAEQIEYELEHILVQSWIGRRSLIGWPVVGN